MKMSEGPYRSTGTIRVRFKRDDAEPPNWATKIFFTPNADSTVRDGGNNYAVFIGGEKDDDCRKRKLRDSGEGVQIKVTGDCPGLVPAATQQTLVEVEVEVKKCKSEKCKSDLVLHAIKIPATSKKK